MRHALCVWLLLASAGVCAAPTITKSNTIPGMSTIGNKTSVVPTGTVTVGSGSNSTPVYTYTSPSSGSGVVVANKAQATTPSGKVVDVTIERTVEASQAQQAIVAIAKNLVPGVSLAMDLWEIFKGKGVEPDSAGNPTVDPGQQRQPGYCWNTNYSGCQEDPNGQLEEVITTQRNSCANNSGYSFVIESRNVSVGADGTATYTLKGKCTRSEPGGGTSTASTTNLGWTARGIPKMVCPQTDSRLPVASGGQPCPSSNRTPAPPGVVEGAAGDVPKAKHPGVVQDMTEKGPGLDTSPPVIKNPGVVEDGTERTTRPDGTVIERKREWVPDMSTPGEITWIPRLTETGPGGPTVTTGNGPNMPSAQTSPEQKTDCDKYPDSIGCSKYGTPEGEVLPKSTQGIDITPVSLPGGSCPGNQSFSVAGHSYTLEFTPICNGVRDYVKPLVLVLGGFLSIVVFIGGLKS